MQSNTYLLRANPGDWILFLLDGYGSHKSIEFIRQSLKHMVSDILHALNIYWIFLKFFLFASSRTLHIFARFLMLSSLARCNKSMGRLFLSINRTILASTRQSLAASSSKFVTRFFKQAILSKPFQLVVCTLLTSQLTTPTSRSHHLKWQTLRMNGLTQNQATTLGWIVILQKIQIYWLW